MKVFISSTYTDLVDHRASVDDVVSRIKLGLSSMEHFGSRTDTALPVCEREIDECDILIGIYAWKYGWCPDPGGTSITEAEFDYARKQKKKCLCYVVDEDHPWRPNLIDHGEPAQRLAQFKDKVSALVRSTFTTPDNLAKQVVADLSREFLPPAPRDSFGGLLRVNWEVFSPEVQGVLSTAYAQARSEADDGVVATRHVIAAIAETPNTGRFIVTAYPQVDVPTLHHDLTSAPVEEMFGYAKPVSSCILASMDKLLPRHSATQRLLAIELAVDLLKHGTGSSIADYRRAGIDARSVDVTLSHIRRVSSDTDSIRDALRELSDAEVVHAAYLSGLDMSGMSNDVALREYVLTTASEGDRLIPLVGELIRRYPKLSVIA